VERRERSDVVAYDLATRDKLPVIRRLMACDEAGLALDIGIGTGYTTARVFGERPTVCVDTDLGNLRLYREYGASAPGVSRPMCVLADASALPFKPGAFRFVLCSEVLEHLDDDRGAVRELERVLAGDGRAVITVPYSGLGFTSFLELLGIKTVHDFPGPERHVRPGYDERTLERVLGDHGLQITQHEFYFRFFTRLAADGVSLAHLFYQRIVHGRRSWTWANAAEADGGLAFRLYVRVFPLLRAFAVLDRLLRSIRGFGFVVAVSKQATRCR
jgi:SAM-dependent methyltransferase